MKWPTLIVIALALYGQSPVADPALPKGRLHVIVPDLASDAGQVRIWVHDATTFVQSNFEKRDDADRLQLVAVTIENRQAEWISDPLPYGDYAVAVHHDANGDGLINFGKLLPTEALGYSNYDGGIAGYPDFDTARFTLDTPERDVRVEAFMQGHVFRRHLKE